MATNEAKRTHETLTPAEREDVLVTLGPADLLDFVEALAEKHPNVFDQVTDHLTRTLWSA